MSHKTIVVFTDGSCTGNGTPNAIGGIGIHFPNGELKDISKIYRQGLCTNQKAELYAILSALRYIKQNLGLRKHNVTIKTDSQYSIDCVTKWVYSWLKNGWMTQNNKPVANREFIEVIHKYYEKYNIDFEHVDGHTNLEDTDSVANARADELATRATKKAKRQLKDINLRTPPSDNKYSLPKKKYPKKTKAGSKKIGNKKRISSDRSPLSFPSGNFVVELVKNSK